MKIGGYCAECSKTNGKVKIEATTLEKFGCKNVMYNDAIKQKICETNMVRYGVAHNSQSETVKEKKKQTNLTNYGVEYSLQSPIVRRKICDTNIQRYGAENPTQNKDIQQKIETTNILRYGTKCPMNNQMVKAKGKQTNIRKYGVEHHLQNPEYAEKHLQATYKRKQYTMPSGNVIDYQGYENFGFDRLLNEEHIDEHDIITKRTEVPEIWYVDKNGKKRRHYVDMFVKSQNRCIEIKSKWTMQEKNYVYEKQAAGIQLGYNYEVWIFDANGNMI